MDLKAPKVYRDPVHDIISYEREGNFGRLIVTLIDSPEFQRLRFIRQVGLASLVFHGAEHSRFAHSMGVASVARRMFDQIHPGRHSDDATRVATVVAALLHDIGHGPFSHAMERVFGFCHEEYTKALICDDESTVCQILRVYDPALPEHVASYIDGTTNHHTQEIVSSQMDADRFDYLLRDSLMTGVEVGRYDLERILLMLEYDEKGLVVNVRAFESIEGYLIARYHMYRLVYFHKAVRAAEAMLLTMFGRARELMLQGQPVVDKESPLGRLMRGCALSPQEFSQLSEIEAWAQIRRWSLSSDMILADLASSLVERRLFRSLEQSVEDSDRRERLELAEDRIRQRLAPGSDYHFVVDVAQDEPYQPYLPDDPGQKNAIRIRYRDGSLSAIEKRSPLADALARASYRLRRWCYHPAIEEVVRDVSSEMGL